MIALLPSWGERLGSLICFDKETGVVSWQRRVKGNPRLFILPDDAHLAVSGTLCTEVSHGENVQLQAEPYDFYVMDQSGKILSEGDVGTSIEITQDGELLVTVIDRDSVESLSAGNVVEEFIRPRVDVDETE